METMNHFIRFIGPMWYGDILIEVEMPRKEIHPDQSAMSFGEPEIKPCPPDITPKQLILKVIARETARNIWLTNHYLHRDVPGASLELGIFTPDGELRGAMCYSQYVVGTKAHPQHWELRRMWLTDDLPKHSESRVLRVSFTIIRKLNPKVKWIVSYSDPSRGHKGTIYKAAGFRNDGWSGVSEQTGKATDFNPYGNTKDVDTVSKRRWIKRLFWDMNK